MGLEEISVAGRVEGLEVFQTLRDIAEVSLVLQDAHEVVAVGDQLLYVDVSRGIDHFSRGRSRTGSVSMIVV